MARSRSNRRCLSAPVPEPSSLLLTGGIAAGVGSPVLLPGSVLILCRHVCNRRQCAAILAHGLLPSVLAVPPAAGKLAGGPDLPRGDRP